VPFALVVGAAVASSANPWAAWLATWTIYGGAAHLTVLGVLAQGSGWAAVAAVGLLVNARLSAYATAMAPQWRSAPRGQRALAALMLTDLPWALARDRKHGLRQFYLGAAGTLFVGWPALVTVGVLVGSGRLPSR
jgi:predicted branched-subunit amino acid permease